MARVTVGIPAYNRADTLARAIDSVLAQTFADFEVVVSDNASTDETSSIGCRYADTDARIRYHRQAATTNAVDNFRFVLEQARTPYFMWLAADDYLLPTMLERAV